MFKTQYKSLMTDKDRDVLNTQANKIREEIIMKACADLQDQLFMYADETIVSAKTINVRMKLTII